MRGRLLASALLVVLLALPMPIEAQAGADYNVNGVDYYYAEGTHASGHFAVGPDAATTARCHAKSKTPSRRCEPTSKRGWRP